MVIRGIFLCILILFSLPALASSTKIPAYVESVYDGDTLKVRALPWPGVEIKISVRIDGIDTPELRGKCVYEKQVAVQARDFLKKIVLPFGDSVPMKIWLIDPKHGKYAGRVVAKVETPEGMDVAKILIAEGLARPYKGDRRKSWCE